MTPGSGLFVGDVVHKRLRPKPHALRYRVFNILLDLDTVDETARRCRFFSRNAWNLLSFHDADYAAGEKAPLAQHARRVFREGGFDLDRGRILLLAYPRVLGYVFNPLTVYFGFGETGRLEALIYEVSNTFGERKSYLIAAGPAHSGVYEQGCTKKMFVSPFAAQQGRYGFRVSEPNEKVIVGVSLRDAVGPLIKTHFQGERRPLTDAVILSHFVSIPFLTAKVIGAIHWEALKLWWKGVPLIRGQRSPRYSVSASDASPSTGHLK